MSPRPMLAVMIAFFAASQVQAESFQSWAARGAREEREKDPKAAFSSYSNALSLWDEDDGGAGKAKVLCARSALREKAGDDKGALEDLSGCLAIDKKNAKGFHRRGALLLKARKIPAAIGDFYKAVALDSRFAQAYADRARAYELQGEMGFAREDYRQACGLGMKDACAKAKDLSSPRKDKPDAKTAASPVPGSSSDSAEDSPIEPAEIVEPAAVEAAPAPKAAVEVPAAKASPVKPPAKRPTFRACIAGLNACAETGDSYLTCVKKAPACETSSSKSCCPGACKRLYREAVNGDLSEAEAFRKHFSPGAACAKPKEAEED